jgi:hypothetical protein
LTKQLDKKNITQVVDGHSASENGMPPNRAHMHGSERVTGNSEAIHSAAKRAIRANGIEKSKRPKLSA